MADQKLTELNSITTVGPLDLLYVVQNGVSKKITVGSLLSSLNAPLVQSSIATTVVGSKNIISTGTSVTDPWIVLDRNIYPTAIIDIVAVDQADVSNYSVGQVEVHWTTGTTVTLGSSSLIRSGSNTIDLVADAGTGTTIRVSMVRSAASVSEVRLRWSAKLFPV
jgi:hypothetical protein